MRTRKENGCHRDVLRPSCYQIQKFFEIKKRKSKHPNVPNIQVFVQRISCDVSRGVTFNINSISHNILNTFIHSLIGPILNHTYFRNITPINRPHRWRNG